MPGDNSSKTVQYDLLVGADGVGSSVRAALQQHYPDMTVVVDDSGREYKVYGGVRGDIEPEGEEAPGRLGLRPAGSSAGHAEPPGLWLLSPELIMCSTARPSTVALTTQAA